MPEPRRWAKNRSCAPFPRRQFFAPVSSSVPKIGFFNLLAAIARISPIVPVMGASPQLLFREGALPEFKPFGKGGPRFQPVYVGDVAEAIVRALDSPEAQGKRYELGGPRVYTMLDIVQLVLRQTGRKRLLLPAPLWALGIEAALLELVGLKLLTRDQVRLLRRDNVVSRRALSLSDLRITPATAEIMLPTYLSRFQRPVAAV